MGEFKLLIELWPLLVAIISLIGWLIRIESKVLYLERDHTDSKTATYEREKEMWKQFNDVNEKLSRALQSLSKIEGRLESRINKE